LQIFNGDKETVDAIFDHPPHRETIIEPGMVLSFQPSVRTDG